MTTAFVIDYVGPFIFGFLVFLAMGLFTDARFRRGKRMTLVQRLLSAAVAGLLTIALGKVLH